MDWCWSWSSNTLATWCKELTHWKRSWCWEGLKAGGEGVTEEEMVGWHHRLNGHEFAQALGDSDGQGSPACCSPWGCKESDMTEQLNNNQERGKAPVEWKKFTAANTKMTRTRTWSQAKGSERPPPRLCTAQSPVHHHCEGTVTCGQGNGWGWAPRGGRSVGGRRSQPTLGRRSTYVEHRRSFDCQVCWEVYYELEYKNLGGCVCVYVVRFYSLCLLRCLFCKKQPHLLDWIIKICISTHVVLRARPGMKCLMPTT